MPATVIVGLQWGDEGKGKTTDFLAEQVAMVVRYQGGDNAGHTVVSGDEVFKLRLDAVGRALPAHHLGHRQRRRRQPGDADRRARHARRARHRRRARPGQPQRARDHAVPRRARPGATRRASAAAKVGTTRPRDRARPTATGRWRLGLRMEDLLDRDVLRERLERVLPDKNLLLAADGRPSLRGRRARRRRRSAGASACATTSTTRPGSSRRALARGEHVLLEGAQGTLLDLDHGSYPFVTSSNPVAGGACTGGGIGPLQVDEVIGVMKAYSTRVGSGPYPTELHDEIGAGIAERGHEFGTTTGRPRRVGWFDAVPLRYAVAVNSVSSIMLNKLDILSGHRPDPAVRRLRDRRPAGRDAGRRAARRSRGRRRSTRRSPGWAEPIHDVRSLADLPENARRYVSAHRGARRRADRARLGRAGADPDDRAGLAADAPPRRALPA